MAGLLKIHPAIFFIRSYYVKEYLKDHNSTTGMIFYLIFVGTNGVF